MPETYSQENLQRAQSLLSGSAEGFVHDYVSMTIYNVSNNALDLGENDKWGQTMKVLEECGIFRLDLDIGRYESPTIHGFIEKLFDASILRCIYRFRDARAETAVKWLVTSGYCPNTAAKTLCNRLLDFPHRSSNAQEPIIDLTKHLLNTGADANMLVAEQGRSQTILEIALQQSWSSDSILNLAELLFKHGASRNLDRALHLAIRRKEKDLVEMIVQHGGDLTANLEPSHASPLGKETALTVAAFTSLQQTRHILDLLSNLYPLTPLTTFITPDVLIAAATEGHNDIISSLYTISPAIMADEYGITPLHIAARWGHLRTCQLLLPLQGLHNTRGTPKLSPLHAACYGGHKDVAEFLIMNGADVDAAPGFDSVAEETRFGRRFNMPNVYAFNKAPLGWLLNENRGTFLEYEQRLNFLCCAAILIRAGARLVGSELHIAAEYCHLELLTAGIAAGADPNKLDYTGRTALQCALRGNSKKKSYQLHGFITHLLLKGAHIPGGEVAIAVGLRQFEVARVLVENCGNMTKTHRREVLETAILAGSNILASKMFELEPSIYSAGALYAAIAMGNSSLIQSLMRNRPDETSEDPFEITAIAVAAMSGDLVLLQSLLARPPSRRTGPLPLRNNSNFGGFVEYSLVYNFRNDYYWQTDPIHLRSICHNWLCGSPLALIASSIHSNALEVCGQLLGSGFCADELTWVLAASSNNTAFVQILLNHGQHGDYNYRDFSDMNPLVFAIRRRNKELITLLLMAGVHANARGSCVAQIFLAAVAEGDLDIVDRLIQDGANVNANDESLNTPTPLHMAVREGKSDIVDRLIQAGANVNPDNESLDTPTPLQIAVKEGNLDIVDRLIQAGANVNPNNGSLNIPTPLQIAVREGNLDIVDYLIRAGANVNSPPQGCSRGATALQFAAINGHLGLAKYLIDEGAEVNALPSKYYGRTALQGAAEHGRLDMLEFLLRQGALTTGRWRRRFIIAVKLAIKERHLVAANLLKQSGGWSEEDENSLRDVDVDVDDDSEESEFDDAVDDDTIDSDDEDCDGGFDVGYEMDMDEEEQDG